MAGLPVDLVRRYPHQLSGGQARRVGIARALRSNPIWSSPMSRLQASTSRCRARC
ncbi:hypothetical protein NKI06_26350 [Mesorhizobium sp. M0772]